MLKLMKLELKKYKIGRYLPGILIANAVILLLIGGVHVAEQVDGVIDAYQNYKMAFSVIIGFVKVTFVIFASVILAKLVIGEYNSKTVNILFTYPVRRKKIMAAKLLLVSLWTFVTVLFSGLFVTGAFLLADAWLNMVPETLTTPMVVDHVLRILLNAVSAAGVCLIPLLFGMMKKSVPATIVSAVILVTITDSNNMGFSLSAGYILPLVFATAGVLIAFWSIRKIETSDVL
ncbi:ABC transporter permease [Paenibacillus chitinolyticus]|uniref:ABC transporter permease n=1 Tax=Paenibacillus chitinolyticus TaxID=79263 RepID=UPI002DB9BDCA|nr:ABC transporter permease [Paenibacillus chitinolyticus]MEC0248456.1 ABC transporter permease [Paenibacillus chitinolyticus]